MDPILFNYFKRLYYKALEAPDFVDTEFFRTVPVEFQDYFYFVTHAHYPGGCYSLGLMDSPIRNIMTLKEALELGLV